jgi:hypothetical protein
MACKFKEGDIVRKIGEYDKVYTVKKVRTFEPRYQIQFSIDLGSLEWVKTADIEFVKRP